MLGKFKTEILLSADLQASHHIYSRRSRLLFAFFAFPPWERRCVEKSGILVSQPSPLGKGDRVSGARGLS